VFAQKKLVQVGQCRQDEHIMIDLARRLGLPGAKESLEDIFNQRLEPLGIDFEELKRRGCVHPPHEYRKFEEKGFRTPSRKVELYSKGLERLGYDPLPTYLEPPESPLSTPKRRRKYPYVLTTGARITEFFCSEHRQIKRLRERRPDPVVQMHSETAAAEGISDGDWVRVSTPRGSIRMKASVSERIRPGTVNIDHGWWFPERGGPDFGVFESNANVLTSAEPPYDPGFGSYQLRALLCRLDIDE
jgi:thiosulfate reductase/polysulfide reductase chain A